METIENTMCVFLLFRVSGSVKETSAQTNVQQLVIPIACVKSPFFYSLFDELETYSLSKIEKRANSSKGG